MGKKKLRLKSNKIELFYACKHQGCLIILTPVIASNEVVLSLNGLVHNLDPYSSYLSDKWNCDQGVFLLASTDVPFADVPESGCHNLIP